MTVRLTLVCHASTAALTRAAFPADEPLSDRGAQAAAAGATFDGVQTARCGPEVACAQTAKALGLTPIAEPALRDCDYGSWRGRSLEEIEAADPAAVTSWLTDPAAAPHGGESLLDLLGRVRDCLTTQSRRQGRRVAVTGPAVIRAAVVTVLDAPPASFWRIDIPPLSQIHLTSQGGVWRLRGTA